MPDIQATPDTRGIAIDQVGVSDLRYPIQVTDQHGKPFPTVATISMSVHLPHQFKGTHMSRFLEVLSKHEGEVTSRTLPNILHDLKQRLHAEEAHIEVAFTYFVTKQAPVSGAAGQGGLRLRLHGHLQRHQRRPGAARDRAGHHPLPVQQGDQRLRRAQPARLRHPRSPPESQGRRLGTDPHRGPDRNRREIRLRAGLCPAQAPDERHVTMQAYDNPVFVEDVVRNAAALLLADKRVASFTVKAVNQESIHDHNAFAVISGRAADAELTDRNIRARMIIPAAVLLDAYARGVFPMAHDGEILWFSPERRGLIPLDDRFHVPHGLRRSCAGRPFEVRWDTAFREVMLACAYREETWIDEVILESYCALHSAGFAHSVECWDGDGLQGGLYGVELPGVFFGESMFSRKTDASKIALVALVGSSARPGFPLARHPVDDAPPAPVRRLRTHPQQYHARSPRPSAME